MNTKLGSGLLVLATIGFSALLVIGLLVTRPGGNVAKASPVLPISLVGFTNDTRGTRLAVFAVSNVFSRQIGYTPGIEFKERTGWQSSGWHSMPTNAIAPHQRSSFSVTNPIEGTWRVSLLYELTPTWEDELGFSMRRFFYRQGIYSLANRIPTEKFKAYTTSGPEMTD